jgi:hypothetical protein
LQSAAADATAAADCRHRSAATSVNRLFLGGLGVGTMPLRKLALAALFVVSLLAAASPAVAYVSTGDYYLSPDGNTVGPHDYADVQCRFEEGLVYVTPVIWADLRDTSRLVSATRDYYADVGIYVPGNPNAYTELRQYVEYKIWIYSFVTGWSLGRNWTLGAVPAPGIALGDTAGGPVGTTTFRRGLELSAGRYAVAVEYGWWDAGRQRWYAFAGTNTPRYKYRGFAGGAGFTTEWCGI